MSAFRVGFFGVKFYDFSKCVAWAWILREKNRAQTDE